MSHRRQGVASLAQRVAALVTMRPRTLGDALAQIACLAAAWPRLSAHERRKVRAAADGAVDSRRDRRTGRRLLVFGVDSGNLDVDCVATGDRYMVLCEEHSTCVHVPTLHAARATGCLDFCDECREVAR